MSLTPEQFDRWRVMPRILVLVYGWAFFDVIQWFMQLADPTNPQSVFVSTVVGAAAGFFGFYVNSGRKCE